MIIKNDQNTLRKECIDVLPEEVDDLISKLEFELEQSAKLGNPGIGLAAPQIGINKKAAIIRINDLKINLINAKIEKGYDLSFFDGEGCLSFPDKVLSTNRYKEIYVIDNLVEPYSFVTQGVASICIQHEIDHYNGILMFDREINKPKIKKLKPNDLCNCGIVDKLTNKPKKYKKCCGK